jgi:hypothetical protein
MQKSKKYFILGIYFIFIELIFFAYTFSTNNLSSLFWICYFTPLLLTIAFLSRNEQFIKGVINISFFPQIIFILLSILYFSTGVSLFDVSMHLNGIIKATLNIFLHLFSTNVALFFTYKIKPKPVSIIYSFSIAFLAIILTFLFTSPSQNINLFSSAQRILNIPNSFSILIWMTMIILMSLGAYFIQKNLSNNFINSPGYNALVH